MKDHSCCVLQLLKERFDLRGPEGCQFFSQAGEEVSVAGNFSADSYLSWRDDNDAAFVISVGQTLKTFEKLGIDAQCP